MHRSSANSQGLRLRQIHRLSPPSVPWPTRRHAENLWKRIHSVVDWSSFKTLSNQYHKLILSSKKKVTTPTLYFQSLTTPNVFGKQSTTPVPQILHTATDHLIVLALYLQTALLLFSHAKYPNYECLSPAILLHHLCIYLSSPATPPRFFQFSLMLWTPKSTGSSLTAQTGNLIQITSQPGFSKNVRPYSSLQSPILSTCLIFPVSLVSSVFKKPTLDKGELPNNDNYFFSNSVHAVYSSRYFY